MANKLLLITIAWHRDIFNNIKLDNKGHPLKKLVLLRNFVPGHTVVIFNYIHKFW